MDILKLMIAILFSLGGLIAWIYILVDAFREAIWKGVVGLLCGFYLLWYALFEFDHENKWLIVLLAVFGSGIGAGISRL